MRTVNRSMIVLLSASLVAACGGGSTVFAAAETRSRGDLLKLRVLIYGLALEQLDADISAGGGITAAATATENCPGGGTRTLNATDKNNNGRLDAGDSGGVTYNNCAEAGLVQNK